MKRTSIATTLLFTALSTTAFAADLPNIKGPPVYAPPPAPVFTWTGFYIGINGGYGGDRFVYPFDVTDRFGLVNINGSASITSGGFVAGGQGGFNYQFAGTPWVIGAEADGDWSSIRGQITFNANSGLNTLNANAGTHLDWFGTARARFGYAINTGMGNLLPYVTGGFAYGETTNYANLSINSFGVGVSQSNHPSGWTVGGGLEYAITPNLTFKTEYLYVNLGTKTIFSNTFVFLRDPINVSIGERSTFNVVRAGLNWKFDWFAPPAPAPVVAKY